MSDRFKLVKQMYLESLDKLWGYIDVPIINAELVSIWSHNKPYWYTPTKKMCWWANTKKTICLQRVSYKNDLATVEHKKSKNGYKSITEQELLNLWPTFKQDLNDRLLYEIMADNV